MPKAIRIILNVLRGLLLVLALYFVIFESIDEGTNPEELPPSVLLFVLFVATLSVALSPSLWSIQRGSAVAVVTSQQSESTPVRTAAPAQPGPPAPPQAQQPGHPAGPPQQQHQQQHSPQHQPYGQVPPPQTQPPPPRPGQPG